MKIKAQDADISIVLVAAIPSLKEEFRRVVSKEEQGDEIRAKIYLLRLGDAPMIAKVVKVIAEDQGLDEKLPDQTPGPPPPKTYDMVFYVERARQPLFIPAIAPFLYSRVSGGIIGRDQFVLSKACYIATMIRSTICHSAEFSPELQAWANGAPGEDFICQMQEKWEQNKEAFKAGKYGEVKPPKMKG